jgi:hypothetical protein
VKRFVIEDLDPVVCVAERRGEERGAEVLREVLVESTV